MLVFFSSQNDFFSWEKVTHDVSVTVKKNKKHQKNEAWMMVLGVRIMLVLSAFLSFECTVVHSIKLIDLLSRWRRQFVPSCFYQDEESFMLLPTVFPEIL